MKTIEQLYNGFYLDNKSANSQISNNSNSLRVPPIKKVKEYENLKIDNEHFSFAEKNKAGDVEYFHGLKNFLRIENTNSSPIFIFDNHNHAIIFRYNIIYNNKIEHAELIHIDQHSDCRENQNHLNFNPEENNLDKIFKFGNEKCNVGNFIPPAIESGIISQQTQIRSITALENLNINKNQKFILDIDLDFCLDGINRNKIDQKSVKILKEKFDEYGKSTLCTTIATSPYFLNQELAIQIIEKLLTK